MHTSVLPAFHPREGCSAWAPLAPRSGATAPPPAPHTAAVPAPLPPLPPATPDSGPPLQPPAALWWRPKQPHRRATCPPPQPHFLGRKGRAGHTRGHQLPARCYVTGLSPESPVYTPAFEDIWRTPSRPGQAKPEGSRAVQSVGTTLGRPVGRSHGSGGFSGRRTAGRGLLGCEAREKEMAGMQSKS